MILPDGRKSVTMGFHSMPAGGSLPSHLDFDRMDWYIGSWSRDSKSFDRSRPEAELPTIRIFFEEYMWGLRYDLEWTTRPGNCSVKACNPLTCGIWMMVFVFGCLVRSVGINFTNIGH